MSNRRATLLLLLAVATAGCIEIEDDDPPPDRSPVARITVEPASGPAPLTVRVSGQASSAPAGTITSYAWQFGDGASASGGTAEHTYSAVGAFVITLTVTDDQGRSGSTTVSVVATGPEAVYDASAFDATDYQDEPGSGTYDGTPLQ